MWNCNLRYSFHLALTYEVKCCWHVISVSDYDAIYLFVDNVVLTLWDSPVIGPPPHPSASMLALGLGDRPVNKSLASFCLSYVEAQPGCGSVVHKVTLAFCLYLQSSRRHLLTL